MKSPAEKKEPTRVLCAGPIRSWPVKERSRERLLADGPARLSDAEPLAVILRVGNGSFQGGVSGKSAYDLALSLPREFRGLGKIDRTHSEALRKVSGLGPAKVAQIKAALELGKRLCAGRLTAPGFASSTAVAGRFRPLFTGRRQEGV
jgi:DNA repair protein RadC